MILDPDVDGPVLLAFDAPLQMFIPLPLIPVISLEAFAITYALALSFVLREVFIVAIDES